MLFGPKLALKWWQSSTEKTGTGVILKSLTILCLICLALALIPNSIWAGEVDKYPELKSEIYNFEAGGNKRSKFYLFLGDTFGGVDLGKQVKDSMKPYEKDLSGYFKPGELNQLIDNINARTKRDIIKGDLTDKKAMQVLAVFGNEFIGKIADRILEKQGVNDKSRRDLWVAKILAPYQRCNARATNAYYHSKHCLESLASALVPNAGVALVYELTKSNLAGSLPTHEREVFLDKQTNDFAKCAQSYPEATADQVMNCAINTMKNGVQHVSKVALPKQVLPSIDNNKTAYAKIESTVFPPFQSCVSKVGSNPNADLVKEFYGCLDSLVINTGGEVVNYKINNTEVIKETFPKDKLLRLTTEKTQEFKTCMLDTQKKNLRKDGMLDTSVCESRITNSITYLVINSQFADTAKGSSTNVKEVQALEARGKKILDSCWKSDMNEGSRENCIRKSVIDFADAVAVISFDKAIPNDLKTKNEITSSGQKDLKSCLEKNLTDKPSLDPDLSKKLDDCKFGVTVKVAVRTAEDSIKDLGKDLTQEKLNSLIKTIVHAQFKSCLGTKPSDKELDSCSNTLKINAAKDISKELFEKNIDDFINQNGGMAKLGLKQNDLNLYKKNITLKTNQCIDQGKNSPDVMVPITKCLKDSIKDLSLYLGSALYDASTSDMYKDRRDVGDELRSKFRQSLTQCLSEKDPAKFSIGDYTAQIDICTDRVGKTTMLVVGTDQIDHNIQSNLSDTATVNLANERKQLKDELLKNFSQCLNSSKKTDPCIDGLKKNTTKSIVLAYGKSQVKSQLSLNESPLKVKLIEDKFKECVEKSGKDANTLSTELDECIKGFAIEFAKTLGEMKVLPLLKKTLGSEDYDRNRDQVDILINNYKKCLNDLYPVSMQDGFMEKVTLCTKGLEGKTIGFVKSVMDTWMTTDEEDKISKAFKDEFSSFLPCLGAALPGGEPWSEMDDKKVDSLLKPAAILLGQYIDYDINVAKKSLSEIIDAIAKQLRAGDTDKAKKEAIELLEKNGALDQLLKTMVRSNVVDAFKGISDKEVPLELKDELTRRETINAIFEGEFGKKLRAKTMEKVILPAIIQGRELSSPELTRAQDEIKDDVIVELVNSPRFGTKLVDYAIEKQLSETGWFTKFVGKALYSGDAFVWGNLKTTPSGKNAEQFIKQHILIPRFKGQKIDLSEERKIMEKAESLVTLAVKRYSDEKKN